MPDFENLERALLSRGEPDRVPQFELAVEEEIKSRLLGRPVSSLEDEVDFFMRAGYDFVSVSIGMRQTVRGEKKGVLGAKAMETSVLKPMAARYNPHEEGTRVRMWAEERAGIIHDEASLDGFDWPDPESFSYETVERLGSLLPEGARLIVNVGYIFSASWMLMGLERFCIALAEGSPLVPRLIERVGGIQSRVVEKLLEFDCVGAICMPDDIAHSAGLMVHPAVLREHVFPWNRRIGEAVRDRGLPYIYHSDGRIVEVIEDLIEDGFNAVHPCEPASVDITELKRRTTGRLCLCGNINLDSTLTLGTPEDVENEVRERIRTVGPGGGYCCGSSNSVPEYVPFENYVAMLEAVENYGKYPINA